MELIDKKKLVAEKLMGWEQSLIGQNKYFIYKNGGRVIKHWNPQADRNAWDEIWDKMDDDMFSSYMSHLSDILIQPRSFITVKMYHTVKPSINLDALVKAIQEMKK